MNDSIPFAAPFSALATVYDRAGFAAYSARAVERYLEFAQRNDWAGRRIIDAGCRTGMASWWLAQQGYRVTGVEESEALIEIAAKRYDTRELAMGSAPDFVHNPLEGLSALSGMADLVLAMNGVLHVIGSLREMEYVFSGIHTLLDRRQLLIFDLETIGGLAASAQAETVTLYDDPRDATVLARARFNYETLTRTTHYTVWQRIGGGWRRADEQHTARGYPVQAIRALLERTGFALRALLTPDMQPVDLAQDQPARVVFVAEKLPDSA